MSTFHYLTVANKGLIFGFTKTPIYALFGSTDEFKNRHKVFVLKGLTPVSTTHFLSALFLMTYEGRLHFLTPFSVGWIKSPLPVDLKVVKFKSFSDSWCVFCLTYLVFMI